ncbi:tripartite tricarboxylate transporter substrate binding protein [Acetobacteraceae bacterium H6797]|nr:tripartite tricarboxylate transporter substrate binding protein [Acetobacteraceae bacterium H6797]
MRPAWAAWSPDRPFKLIVPFAAGGPADIFGRIFAEALGKQLSQAVVVENRVGAGGLIGTDAVAKAAPDGFTLGLTGPGALSVAPALPQQKMPFDIYKDLAHLTLVARVPEVLVVNAASGPVDLPALIAKAKGKPGAVTYGSAGAGSLTHLASALFSMAAGLKTEHIPYRGAAPASTDLLAGRIDFMIADVPVLKPHIDAGAMRALAVTTAQRVSLLPTVATMGELGLAQVNSDNWYGLAVPAATPAETREALLKASQAALRDPKLLQDFARQAGQAAPLDPDSYVNFLRAETTKWGAVVRETGLEAM